ncbi:MAG: TraM recognition domain-containing protein [Phycisphaerales bacterium]
MSFLNHFFRRRAGAAARGTQRDSALPPTSRWDPETPIMPLGGGEFLSLRDFYCGVQVWGSTGSSKSTATMASAVEGLFSAGAGALCLCAKREDRWNYEAHARACGRGQDVMIFGPDDSPLRYNFIDAELARDGSGAGLVTNLTALLSTVAEVARRGHGSSGTSEGEGYFRLAAEQLSRNALELLLISGQRITIPALHRFIASLPSSLEQAASESWKATSLAYATMELAGQRVRSMSESRRADYELAIDYVFNEYATMSARTRSCIVSTLTSALDLLSRGTARDLLSSPTSNVSPEMCWDGAIVIVDVPALVYLDVARLIGVIMKYCWQRAAMRRDLSKGDRPMAIIVDESHLFAAEPDWEFQAVARGTHTATLLATQSLSNYLEVFGERGEARVHSLLGNLQCQLFHQLTDTRTIAYVQELLGKRRDMLMNGSTPPDQDWVATLLGIGSGVSAGFSEVWQEQVQAGDLNSLARGGPTHGMVAEAIVYRGGHVFGSTGRTWRRVAIPQRIVQHPAHPRSIGWSSVPPLSSPPLPGSSVCVSKDTRAL